MDDLDSPHRAGLLKLLSKSQGTQFVIPVYQRNYTWTDKVEVRKFIDDLHDVVTGRYVNHFLGTIIYSTKELDGLSWENSIIDGQQRLTIADLWRDMDEIAGRRSTE